MPVEAFTRGAHRVDPGDRRNAPMQPQVCGRESELPSHFLALDHPAADPEVAAEKRFRFVEPAGRKRLSNARRTRRGAADRKRRNFVHGKTAPQAIAAKRRDVAAAIASEPETLADHHPLRSQRLHQHALNECSGIPAAEFRVESQDPQLRDTRLRNSLGLVPQPHQPGRWLRLRKILARMRLEADDGRRQP